MSNLSVFLNDGFSKVCPISVINCRHLINLSHNEVHHPEYSRLFAEFIADYSVDRITQYPVFEEAHDLASDYQGVRPNQLFLVPGSDFAINLLMGAIGINTKGLIIQSPNYYGYYHYAQLYKVQIVESSAITPGLLHDHTNCLVVLANPEGFFGSVYPMDRIVEIAKTCALQNHLLLIDEAYIEFNTFDHQQLINLFDNVIIVRTYSKGMGLASMRLGTITANPLIVSYLTRFASENSISDIALSYLVFLFKNKERWKKINQEIAALRNFMTERMQIDFPLWKIYISHTNFITIGTRSPAEALAIKKTFMEQNIRIAQFEDKAFSQCIRISMPETQLCEPVLNLLHSAYETNTKHNQPMTQEM